MTAYRFTAPPTRLVSPRCWRCNTILTHGASHCHTCGKKQKR